MRLDKSIKKAKAGRKEKPPLWAGPEDESDKGGVTQSMLTDFLVDRERFRVRVIEGLGPHEGFNHRIEFGNLWHACEEALAAGEDWGIQLSKEASQMSLKYRMNRKDVAKWANVIRVQFPIYLGHWKKTPSDWSRKKQILQEQVFKVPYRLPSGRTVYLRGKWDGASLLKEKKTELLYLDEHKTKGDIDEAKIRRQLSFDIQTMTYLVALSEHIANAKAGDPLFPKDCGRPEGILYNVIRRPLSGGKGTIKQLKPTKKNPRGESEAEYYNRLAAYIRNEPETYFMRWRVEISPADVERFKRQTLDPILENLCDWYAWVSYARDNPNNPDKRLDVRFKSVPGSLRTIDHSIHWRMPYILNPIAEGGEGDVDNYLNTGSEVGLERIETLFRELEE